MERLSKLLASAGIASRRKADDLIRNGRVKVNNIKILDPWFKVDTCNDHVTFDNSVVSTHNKPVYVALYKPTGYLSDLQRDPGRKLARDLVPLPGRLYPVGRLDLNSEGLLLFTNDGSFAYRMMHPRFGMTREYVVKFQGKMGSDVLERVRRGVRDAGDILTVLAIDPLQETRTNTWCRILLGEGKYREIRRIGEAVGHSILKLRRVRMGHIILGSLRSGQFRHLEQWEVEAATADEYEKRMEERHEIAGKVASHP